MGLKEVLLLKIAKKWIAGSEMKDAIDVAKRIKEEGRGVIINYLGEDIVDERTARGHAEEYLRLQRAISSEGIDGSASVKLSQIGLSFSEKFARDMIDRLANQARNSGQVLWIDMEGSNYVDKTLEIYRELLLRYDNVGIALQAYMKRTENDLSALNPLGPRIRLVKGAYREGPDIIYTSREEISHNYLILMEYLFKKGNNFTIATHDSRLIERAKELGESHKTKFEFAMLRGIRDDLKADLSSSGYKVLDYIPYGEQWYSYSVRRIREHPSNILLLLRSMLG